MAKCLKTILLLYSLNFCFELVKSNVDSQEEKRILDKTAVKPGQFPFLVKILDKNGKFLCSGAILSANKVISAAHCLLNNQAKTVVAGSVDAKTKGQQRRIAKFSVHPKYTQFVRSFKKRNRGNDLGMLTIDQTFDFGNLTAEVIQLAQQVIQQGGVVSIGNSNNIEVNEVIEKPRTRGMTKPECVKDGRAHFSTYQLEYKMTGLNEDNPMLVSHAKDSDKVICGKDSGGPLISKDRPYVLHGIHFGNVGPHSYDVSTTIEENRKWILSQLDNKSTKSTRRNGQKSI